jgi:hypothetical protein
MNRIASTDRRAPEPDQLSLFRLGAASGLAAAAFAIVQIAIEVIGVGIAGIPVPDTVEGWFALLQRDRLLAFTELTGLQIPMFALLIPVYLALHAALKTRRPAVTLAATALALVGIGVYLASNTAFAMLSLSDRWATATDDAQRLTLVAAGQAMLATYEGPGLDAGVFLVMVATLGMSMTQLGRAMFGRLAPSAGITAGVLGLSYYIAVFVSSARIFLLEAAGLAFVVWIVLTSRGFLVRPRSDESVEGPVTSTSWMAS